MNDPAVRAWAQHLAKELIIETDDDEALVESAWQRVLGRTPEGEEAFDAVAFLRAQIESGSDRAFAVTDLCQALFATNEFAYVD
jgi:hypothetical protein